MCAHKTLGTPATRRVRKQGKFCHRGAGQKRCGKVAAKYEHRLHYHWSQLEADRAGRTTGSPSCPRRRVDRFLRMGPLPKFRCLGLVASLRRQARFSLHAGTYTTADYNTFAKNGVAKLTEVELYFLTTRVTKATAHQWVVVYLGVGNGERFRYLRDEFFPGLAVIAFDPLDAFFEGIRHDVEKNAAKWNSDGTEFEFLIRCYDEDKDIDWVRERYPNRSMLLISDIRGINLHQETRSFDKACDNEVQLKAIQRLRPVASLLKFAVPDWGDKYYTYAPGRFLKQTFCYHGTSELRLLVEGVPESLVRYNVAEMLDRVVFHHDYMRGQVYRSSRRPQRSSACLCHCFDCTVLWKTVSFYAARNSVDPYAVLDSITKNHFYHSDTSGPENLADVTFYLNQGRLMEAAGALDKRGVDEEVGMDWNSIASHISQQPAIAERLRDGLPQKASRADMLKVIGSLAKPFTLVRTELNGLIAYPPWSWMPSHRRGYASNNSAEQQAQQQPMLEPRYYKREPCWFYVRGRCSKGQFCTYSHGDGDDQPVGSNSPPCWWWLNGMCSYGEQCQFQHSTPDPAPSPQQQ